MLYVIAGQPCGRSTCQDSVVDSPYLTSVGSAVSQALMPPRQSTSPPPSSPPPSPPPPSSPPPSSIIIAALAGTAPANTATTVINTTTNTTIREAHDRLPNALPFFIRFSFRASGAGYGADAGNAFSARFIPSHGVEPVS